MRWSYHISEAKSFIGKMFNGERKESNVHYVDPNDRLFRNTTMRLHLAIELYVVQGVDVLNPSMQSLL